MADSTSVVFSKVSGLVANPVFLDILPILVKTFDKLDVNPAAAPILGAEWMADILPLLHDLSTDSLANAVNLFAAMLAVKQPLEPPSSISGAINTELQAVGVSVK